MNDAEQVLQYYEAISHQSQSMLLAARSGDWDALCLAEQQCVALIALLKQLGDTPLLTAAQKQRRMTLLKKILAEDAEIRDLAIPQLKQLADLLHSSGNARRLGDSYGR